MTARGTGKYWKRGLRIQAHTQRGFTLIELLVVVAVIGLLIALLLPALGKARDIALTSMCLSNNRQMVVSMTVYSNDWKSTTWPVNTWMRYHEDDDIARDMSHEGNANNGKKAGIAFEYIENTGEVLACPKNKRHSATGGAQTVDGKTPYSGPEELDTDYVPIGNVNGLKLHSRVAAGYHKDMDQRQAFIPLGSQEAQDIVRLRSIPMFVEEDQHNSAWHDCRWLGIDAASNRHQGGSIFPYIDGSAELFKPTENMRDHGTVYEDSMDFTTENLRFLGARSVDDSTRGWLQNVAETDNGSPTAFGWINKPHGSFQGVKRLLTTQP